MARGDWLGKYTVVYGLEIDERDATSGAVTSALCLFCRAFGRDRGDAGRTRRRTQRWQYFTLPFRVDVIVRHMATQHTLHWRSYSMASTDVKVTYFQADEGGHDTASPEVSAPLVFYIRRSIVDVVIAEMLFNVTDETHALDTTLATVGNEPEPTNLNSAFAATRHEPVPQGNELVDGAMPRVHHERTTPTVQCPNWTSNRRVRLAPRPVPTAADLKRNALGLFRLLVDDDVYVLSIPSPLRYRLAVQHVSIGLSFSQTEKAVSNSQTINYSPKLRGLTAGMVGRYIRGLVASSLQKIYEVVSRDDVWAFALAFDGSTHRETSFFDVRIRVGVNGMLYNLHLVAIPQFERHTADNQVKMIEKLLDAVIPSWRTKLIGISTDGEPTNTGRVRGVVTQLATKATFTVKSTPNLPV